MFCWTIEFRIQFDIHEETVRAAENRAIVSAAGEVAANSNITKFVRKVRSEIGPTIHAKTTKNKSRNPEYIQKATKQLSQLAAIGEQTVAFGCHFGPKGS